MVVPLMIMMGRAVIVVMVMIMVVVVMVFLRIMSMSVIVAMMFDSHVNRFEELKVAIAGH